MNATGDFEDLSDKEHFTCFLEFRDLSVRKQYLSFKTATTSPSHLLVFSAIVTFLLLSYWSMVFQTHISFISVSLCIFSLAFFVLSLWIIVYCRLKFSVDYQNTHLRNIFKYLESFTVIGCSLSIATIIVMRIARGPCDSLNFVDSWSCVGSSDCVRSPNESLFILLTLPFAFSLVFPFVPMQIIFSTLLFGDVVAVAIIAYQKNLVAVLLTLLTMTFATTALYLHQLQHLKLFLYIRRYYNAMEFQVQEHERNAQQLNNEMRCLIASISHDMKTVSMLKT